MQSLAGRTVLVVDDEPIVRETLRLMLETMGADAVEAPDGFRALELFRTRAFDCVVTDEMMPRMRGHQLAWHLRALKPAVRIVLITAVGGWHDADVLLPTPVRMQELLAAVAGESPPGIPLDPAAS